MDSTLASQFQLLRVRVEADIKRPSVIMVTSAQSKDGKSLTSYGLAECLANVGHRVLLAEMDSAYAKAQEPVPAFPSAERFSTISLPREDGGSASSREAIIAFVAQMRASYDYSIVDAAPLMNNNVAMLLAGSVDAILLAVRRGRPPGEDDQFMVQTLKHIKARVLGVIASSAESIRDFDKARTNGRAEGRIVTRESTVGEVSSAALSAR